MQKKEKIKPHQKKSGKKEKNRKREIAEIFRLLVSWGELWDKIELFLVRVLNICLVELGLSLGLGQQLVLWTIIQFRISV